jgi:Cu2+-containing amine oxidase
MMTMQTEMANLHLTLDGLSRSVTALCLAIDPKCTHGPATESIVSHEKKLRETAQDLCNVIDVLIGIKRGQYSDIQEYCARLKELLKS